MIDGHEHRLTMAAMIAQQIPISSQMAHMMPPPGFWYGPGTPGAQPGQDGQWEEGQQDKRGAIFNFFKQNRNGGAQPAPDRRKTRRRNRSSS